MLLIIMPPVRFRRFVSCLTERATIFVLAKAPTASGMAVDRPRGDTLGRHYNFLTEGMTVDEMARTVFCALVDKNLFFRNQGVKKTPPNGP
jgi:hypothetical protein